jgi:hypothetical protein
LDAFLAAKTSAGFGAKPVVYQFKGRAAAVPTKVPDPQDLIPGTDDEALCFTIDLIDVNKDKVVGTATDCIFELGTVGDGLQLLGTGIFDFGGGHTFTSQGLTSVQPTTHGSPDATHFTLALPSPGDNNIVAATGRFASLDASVRLSGAVDLSELGDGYITFDCLFVVDPNG